MADLSILRRVTAQTAIRPATQVAPRISAGLVLRQFGERYARYEAMSRNWLQSRFDMFQRPGSIARYPQTPGSNYSPVSMALRNLHRRTKATQQGQALDRSFDNFDGLPELPHYAAPEMTLAGQESNDWAYEGYDDDYTEAESGVDSYFAEDANQAARLGDFQPLTMRNLFAVEAGRPAQAAEMTSVRPVNRSIDSVVSSNGYTGYTGFAPSVNGRSVEQPATGVSYQAETALARVFERLNDSSSDSSVSNAMLAARPVQLMRENYGATPVTETAVRRVGQQWLVDLPASVDSALAPASSASAASTPSVPMTQVQRQLAQTAPQAAAAPERIQTGSWVGELGSLRHNPATAPEVVASRASASNQAQQMETSVARIASFEPVVLRSLSDFAEPVSSPVAENITTAPAAVSTSGLVIQSNPTVNSASAFLSVPPLAAQPSPLMRAMERAEVNSGADVAITASPVTEAFVPFTPAYLQPVSPSQTVPANSATQPVQRELEVDSAVQPTETAIAPRSLENNESIFATAANAAPNGYGLQAQLQRFSEERTGRANVATELASLQHNPGVTSAGEPGRIARLAEQEQPAQEQPGAEVGAATALNMTFARLVGFSQPGLHEANEAATSVEAPAVQRELDSVPATDVSMSTPGVALGSTSESLISRFATEHLTELDAAFDLPTLRYNPGTALSHAVSTPAGVVSRIADEASGVAENNTISAEGVAEISPAQAASDLTMTQARLATFSQAPRSQPVGEASALVSRTPATESDSLQVFGLEYDRAQQLRPTAGNALSDAAIQRIEAVDNVTPSRLVDYERISQSGEVTPAEITEVERRYIMPPLAMARAREATAPDLSGAPVDYGSMLRDELTTPVAPGVTRQVYPTGTDFPHLNQISRFVNGRTEISVPERNGLDLVTNRKMSLLDAEGGSEKKDSGSVGFGYESGYAVDGATGVAEAAQPSRTSVLMSQAANLARLPETDSFEAAEAPRFTFVNSQPGFAVQSGVSASASASAAPVSNINRTFANPGVTGRTNTGATASANGASAARNSAATNDGGWAADSGTFASTGSGGGFFEAADSVNDEVGAGEVEMFHPTAWIQRKVADVSPPKAKTTSLIPKIDTVMRSSVGQQIESSALTRMNRIFGHNFEPVRVHTGHEVGEMVNSMGAEAFTAGSNIYFAPGRYQPDSASGQALLGHELTHVMQQASLPSLGGGRVPEVSSQGQAFEHEAQHNENLILRHLESTHSSPAPQPANSRLTTSVSSHSHSEPDLMSQYTSGNIMRSFEPVHLHSHDSQAAEGGESQSGSSSSIQRSVDSSDNQVQRLVATPENYEPGKPADNLTRQHMEMITDEVVRRVRHELMVERERHGINSRRFF